MDGATTHNTVRVAHVLWRLEPGGAELRTLELIARTGGESVGHEVFVASRLDGSLVARFQELCRVTVATQYRFLHWWHLCRERRPDVVHVHLDYLAFPWLAVAWAAGVSRRIAHARSGSVPTSANPLHRMLRVPAAALTQLFATDLIGVSPSALEMIAAPKVFKARAHVVPNGFDQRNLGPQCEDSAVPDITIVHVGRDSPEKKRERAVEIANALAATRNGRRVRVIFVGNVGEEGAARLRRLASKQHPVQVSIEGYQTDIYSYLQPRSVLLLTSIREGLPGVLLEAASVGLASVATDLPSTRFVAEHVPSTILVPYDRSNEDWADAVIAASKLNSRERCAARSQEFSSSIFSTAQSDEMMNSIWRGEVDEAI